MVRSLADRTFQLRGGLDCPGHPGGRGTLRGAGPDVLERRLEGVEVLVEGLGDFRYFTGELRPRLSSREWPNLAESNQNI